MKSKMRKWSPIWLVAAVAAMATVTAVQAQSLPQTGEGWMRVAGQLRDGQRGAERILRLPPLAPVLGGSSKSHELVSLHQILVGRDADLPRAARSRPRRAAAGRADLSALAPARPLPVCRRAAASSALRATIPRLRAEPSGTRRRNSTSAPSVRSTGSVSFSSWSPTRTLKIPSLNASSDASTAAARSIGPGGGVSPIRTAAVEVVQERLVCECPHRALLRGPGLNAATSAVTAASMTCRAVTGPGAKASVSSCSCTPRRRCPVTVARTRTAPLTSPSRAIALPTQDSRERVRQGTGFADAPSTPRWANPIETELSTRPAPTAVTSQSARAPGGGVPLSADRRPDDRRSGGSRCTAVSGHGR